MREPESIRIVGVDVSNFIRLRVAEVRVDPDAGLVRVTGPNRAGKTSLLRAIQGTLAGAKAVVSDPIFHEGEGESYTRLVLSNGWAVERRFSPSSPKGHLAVVSPDGGKYGQTKLDEWLGPHSFDPLAFFSLDEKRRRDTLLSLSRDPELADKLLRLKGEREDLYEERTPWIQQQRKAKATRKPEGEPPEPVDISAELVRLSNLQAEQQRRAHLGDVIQRGEDKLREIDIQMAELVRQRGLVCEALDAKRHELMELPDRSEAIEAVQAYIADANKVQQDMEPWREYERAQRDLAEADAQYAELTTAIESIDAQKVQLLADAGIPVPGVTFNDDGEPLLNGHPLEQASGRERIEVAVAIAMAANPRLRVCLIDEANDLDLEGLERLDALARAHGFQVWAVRIGLEGAGEVVVEDGEARNPETLFDEVGA